MNTNFRNIIILLLANLLFLSSEANGQNLSPASGEINGHEWVDLGLPSGLKWATCNVGASTPEDPGDYFAYGEVSEKDSYVFNNSIKAFSAASTGDTYMIVGDLGEGALANFPNGEEINLKFDDVSLATSDLVKVIGREFVALGVVGPKAFVKVQK